MEITHKPSITWLINIIMMLLLSSGQLFAFEFTPAIASIESGGEKSEQVYLFTNTAPQPAAIEFSIKTMQQREDGSEIQNPAANLFSVHPAQVVIPGGGTQKVRVKWLGGAVSKEQPYRFSASQLPIKLAKEGISLNVVMEMEGILYVKPAGKAAASSPTTPPPSAAAPAADAVPTSTVPNPDQTGTSAEMLQVTAVKAVNTPQGKQLALTVHNPADEHIILRNLQAQLKAGGQTLTLSGQQLGNMQTQNLLGGATRNFIMPIPTGFDPNQNWSATLATAP